MLKSAATAIIVFACAIIIIVQAGESVAQENPEDRSFVIGPKIRAGGRFDNVRMCVATPAGVQGGPAADISVSSDQFRFGKPSETI